MPTVRDLRLALAASSASWSTNKHLRDRDPLPRYATGGDRDWFVRVAPQAPPALRRTRAASVDWRTRFGHSSITGVRDQNPCNACWAFATTALVESMVRIEHGVWCVRSEGDLHKGIGANCASTGNIGAALGWIKENHGLADPDCFPWQSADGPYTPTADRRGRTVKIDDTSDVWMGDVETQKQWLEQVGPLIVGFDVYQDFQAYGSGVYRKQDTIGGAPNPYEGWHFMLAIGYDDGAGCWILKNSWGTGWGEDGFGRIAYGQCSIDQGSKCGLRTTNPDGWIKRRRHNGVLLESGNGATHGNFEFVVLQNGKLSHWSRDNWLNGFPLRLPWTFGDDAACSPALVESSIDWRSLHVVYRTASGRLHHRQYSGIFNGWREGVASEDEVFGPTDATGVPGLIQTNYGGAPGNLETIVCTADGRLSHWYRGGGGGAWVEAGRFGSNVRESGPALIQSHTGIKGNFDLVCVLQNGEMQHWTRDNDHGMTWSIRSTFGTGVACPPCMIEGGFGAASEQDTGNFELCVAVNGGVEHWWLDNTRASSWQRSTIFGQNVASVLGLAQSSFGGGFNLELIVLRNDSTLGHWWRDDGGWSEAGTVG